MKRLHLIYSIVGIFLLLLPTSLWAQRIVEQWSLANVFTMPESATYDIERRQIFVSNVNGYAKDGNGFISRVSANGKELDLTWLAGLDSPTGLLAKDDLLYIVDYDALVIADIEKADIIKRIPAPDVKPGLNDVTVSGSGEVFVTGSGSRSIYSLKEDRLVVWKHDPERLKNANGLLVQNQQLVHGGWFWSIFDLRNKELVAGFEKPEDVIKDIDGITTHPCGGYIVTMIDDTRLWHIARDGSSKPLSEQEINGIDIQRVGNQLFVPVVGGGLRVFEFSDLGCEDL